MSLHRVRPPAVSRVSWRAGVALLVLALLATLAPAGAEQNVRPGINDNYRDPDVAEWRGVFERDGREIWDRRDDIVRALALKPGMRVADVGAGTGFFSLMFAREVGPQGRVYAVDIARNFVDAIVERARAEGLDNVTGTVNDQQGAHLPDAAVDLVFVSDTYHHFEYPRAMLDSIHAALAPGGELVVIDFEREPGVSNPWVIRHVRAGAAQVTAEIEAAGFELVERRDFMRTQFFLRFRKR